MALSGETKEKLLVGGGVGALALLVGYFIVSGRRRSDAEGPSPLILPSGTEGARVTRQASATPTQYPQLPSLPPQPLARLPATHHMKRRRKDDRERHRDDDRDRNRCNERGEYGHKRNKHKGRHG